MIAAFINFFRARRRSLFLWIHRALEKLVRVWRTYCVQSGSSVDRGIVVYLAPSHADGGFGGLGMLGISCQVAMKSL